MKRIVVKYSEGRAHPLVFGSVDLLPAHMAETGLRPGRCVVVTDRNVAEVALQRLTGNLKKSSWEVATHVIEPGEQSKSLEVLTALFDFALSFGIDRQTPLIALGGGVVGDLAGFAAATLLRGIPLVHVATSLVAQVDSSIGGKTGINHPVGKNLIGSFYQPWLVLSDTSLLQTLPGREWKSGLAEVVKHALLDGYDHTVGLTDRWEALMSRDSATVSQIIPASAMVKVAVVTADERESGRRAILNLGHTVGHAIERTAGYGDLSHGEAVAAGLAVALRISDEKMPDDDRTAAWDLLRRLGWPSIGHLDSDAILDAVQYDKKKLADTIRFVLLRSPGFTEVRSDVTLVDIRAALDWLASQ